MLFRRSLLQELATSATGAFLILFGIVIAQRTHPLIKHAANGDLPNDAIAIILGFTMIRFLPMILSVSIFLAILITLSRWYRDSEMIIWLSSGLSLKSFLRPVFTFCAPIVTVILLLSLFITPWAMNKIDEFELQLESRDEFAAISPGVFKESSNGQRIFFVENFDELGNVVNNIFAQITQHQKVGVVVAAEGKREKSVNGDHFLVLENGHRYQGVPKTPEYQVTQFEAYGFRIEPNEVTAKPASTEAKSSLDLLKDDNNASKAELEGRFAVPISALILAMLAIPLSTLDPRAGKTANFFMAIFIYLIYNNSLSILQAWIAQGKLYSLIGLWPVHLLFLAIAVYLFKQKVAQKPILTNPFANKNRTNIQVKTSTRTTKAKKKHENSF